MTLRDELGAVFTPEEWAMSESRAEENGVALDDMLPAILLRVLFCSPYDIAELCAEYKAGAVWDDSRFWKAAK